MVYVDAITGCVPNQNWKWNKSCHMFADDEQELHDMAKRIGLKREWFQEHRRLPHYDLTVSRRALAVRYGAKEVDREFLVDFMDKLAEKKAKDGAATEGH